MLPKRNLMAFLLLFVARKWMERQRCGAGNITAKIVIKFFLYHFYYSSGSSPLVPGNNLEVGGA